MSLTWRRITVLVCLAATGGFAEPPTVVAPYSFDAWTFQNGLPQNTIQAICQTRDGYFWMTTKDGIMRFDGARFQVFRSSDIDGIGPNRYSFSALYEDKEGALWAGSYDGGVVRYFHGKFQTFTTKDGLANNSVLRIDGDERGAVWIYCKQGLNQWINGQLILIAPKAGSLFNGVLAPQRAQLGSDSIYYGLWRTTAKGWERFAFGKWTAFPLPVGVISADALQVKSIFEDAERNIWFSLKSDLATYYRLSKEGKLEIIRGVPIGSFVSYRDKQGYLWLTDHAAHTGVWRNGKVLWFIDLHTPTLFHVLADRDGGLWIATMQQGLYHVRPHLIDSFQHQGGPELGTSMISVRNTTDAWIGSLGLQRYGKDKLTTALSSNPFGLRVVRAMAEDADGSLWLGLPQGVRRFRHGRLETDPRTDAIKMSATTIRVSRTGELWIGTIDGLYRVPAANQAYGGKAEKLSAESVSVLFEDRSGLMWVGFTVGLSRYEGAQPVPFGAGGWRYGGVAAIYQDAGGEIWIATNSKGVIRLRDGVATSYTTAEGLPSDAVNQILEDGNGFMWFGTEVGLIRLRRTELDEHSAGRLTRITATRFTRTADNQSLLADSFAQPNCLKRPDGKLWFSILGGVAVVDPATLPLNSNPPAVVTEECTVDHRATDCRDSVTLRPEQENLEIAYTGLSFVRPADVTFKYKLQGADEDWQAVGSRRVAYYSHLPPGHYVFKVRAANSDGIWSAETAGLPVVVLPAFYRTWWFDSALSAALLCMAWYAWRSRGFRFEKNRLAQQAFSRQLIASQENERKRIAAELHDSLGQRLLIMRSLALLQLQSLLQRGVPAPQLEELSEEASLALGEVREISYDLRPYQLDRLGLTKAIQAVIQSAADALTITFSVQLDNIDELFPEQSRINLYRIVQESLNNIIKHSKATQVTIVIERTDNQVWLIIRDNGKGFALDAARPHPGKGGFGLIGIAERAELLCGKTEILSTPGKGTVIKIEFDTRGLKNVR